MRNTAKKICGRLGYEETDVPEITEGIEFDYLTRSQMAELIDGLKDELEG